MVIVVLFLNFLMVTQKMVIPQYQDGRTEEAFIMNKTNAEIDPEQGPSTRQAGGQVITAPVAPKIIVDMREFRSDLPCLIHKRGIEVVPVTITVSRTVFFEISKTLICCFRLEIIF
jgi:predicted transcriptional regulator